MSTLVNNFQHARDADLLRTLAVALGQPVVIAGMTVNGPRYQRDQITGLSLARLRPITPLTRSGRIIGSSLPVHACTMPT